MDDGRVRVRALILILTLRLVGKNENSDMAFDAVLSALHDPLESGDLIVWPAPPAQYVKQLAETLGTSEARRNAFYRSERPPDALQWLLRTNALGDGEPIRKARIDLLKVLRDDADPEDFPSVIESVELIFDAEKGQGRDAARGAALACLRALCKNAVKRNALTMEDARRLTVKIYMEMKHAQATSRGIQAGTESMKFIACLGRYFVDDDHVLTKEYYRNVYTNEKVVPFVEMTNFILDRAFQHLSGENTIQFPVRSPAWRAASLAVVDVLGGFTTTYDKDLHDRPKQVLLRKPQLARKISVGREITRILLAHREGTDASKIELVAKALRCLRRAAKHVAVDAAFAVAGDGRRAPSVPLDPWPFYELLRDCGLESRSQKVNEKIDKHAVAAVEASFTAIIQTAREERSMKLDTSRLYDGLTAALSSSSTSSESNPIKAARYRAFALRAIAGMARPRGKINSLLDAVQGAAKDCERMAAQLQARSFRRVRRGLPAIQMSSLAEVRGACLSALSWANGDLVTVVAIAKSCIDGHANDLATSRPPSRRAQDALADALVAFAAFCSRSQGESALRTLCRQALIVASARHGGDAKRFNVVSGERDDRVCISAAAFWRDVLSRSTSLFVGLIYDGLWRSLFDDILFELDLNYKLVDDDADDDAVDGSEEDPSEDSGGRLTRSGVSPVPLNPFDQELLVNAAGFMVALHSTVEIQKLARSRNLNLRETMGKLCRLSRQRPYVAALYRLAAVAMRNADMEEDRGLLLTCRRFVRDVSGLSAAFRDDLLVAACRLVLEAPKEVIDEPLVVCARAALRGGAERPELAVLAFQAMDRWRRWELITPDVTDRLFPLIDRYARFSSSSQETPRQRWRRSRMSEEERRTEAVSADLAKRALKFLGALGGANAGAAGDASKALRQALSWSPKARRTARGDFGIVKLRLEALELDDDVVEEGQDTTLELRLDEVMPRLADVAVAPGARQTRVVAAEAFHACLVVAIAGSVTSASTPIGAGLVDLFARAFPFMVALAADDDPLIRATFYGDTTDRGLLKQTARWLARPTLTGNTELASLARVFLERLSEVVVTDDDDDQDDQTTTFTSARHRDVAAMALGEFVLYYVKQIDGPSLERQMAAHNADRDTDPLGIIFGRVVADISHPTRAVRRRGGALVLQKLIRPLRTQKFLVSRFGLALFQGALLAIRRADEQFTDDDRIDMEAADLASNAAGRLETIFIRKWLRGRDQDGNRRDDAQLLSATPATHRYPPMSLMAFVDWLWTNAVGDVHHNFRRRAWHCLDAFAPLVPLLNDEDAPAGRTKHYVHHRLYNGDEMVDQDPLGLRLRTILEHEGRSEEEESSVMQTIVDAARLHATLHTYATFVSLKFVPAADVLRTEGPRILDQLARTVKFCGKQWNRQQTSSDLDDAQTERLKMERAGILRRGAELIAELAKQQPTETAQLVVEKNLWTDASREVWLRAVVSPEDNGVLPAIEDAERTSLARIFGFAKLFDDAIPPMSLNKFARSVSQAAVKLLPPAWCRGAIPREWQRNDFLMKETVSVRSAHRLYGTLREAGILEYALGDLKELALKIGRGAINQAKLFPWRPSRDALDLALSLGLDPADLITIVLQEEGLVFYDENARSIHRLLVLDSEGGRDVEDVWRDAGTLLAARCGNDLARRMLVGVLDYYHRTSSFVKVSKMAMVAPCSNCSVPIDVAEKLLDVTDCRLAVERAVTTAVTTALASEKDCAAGMRLVGRLVVSVKGRTFFGADPLPTRSVLLKAVKDRIQNTFPLRHDEFLGTNTTETQRHRQRAYDDLLTALADAYADSGAPELLDRLIQDLAQIDDDERPHRKSSVLRRAVRRAARRRVASRAPLLVDVLRRIGVIDEASILRFPSDEAYPELEESGRLLKMIRRPHLAQRVLLDDILKPALQAIRLPTMVSLARCRLNEEQPMVRRWIDLLDATDPIATRAAAVCLDALFAKVPGLFASSSEQPGDAARDIARDVVGNEDPLTALRRVVMSKTLGALKATTDGVAAASLFRLSANFAKSQTRVGLLLRAVFLVSYNKDGTLNPTLSAPLDCRIRCVGSVPQLRFDPRPTYDLSVAAAYLAAEEDIAETRAPAAVKLPPDLDNSYETLGPFARHMITHSSLGDGLQQRRAAPAAARELAARDFPASLDERYYERDPKQETNDDGAGPPAKKAKLPPPPGTLNTVGDVDNEYESSDDGEAEEESVPGAEQPTEEKAPEEEEEDDNEQQPEEQRSFSRTDRIRTSDQVVNGHPCMWPMMAGIMRFDEFGKTDSERGHWRTPLIDVLQAAKPKEEDPEKRNATVFGIQLVVNVAKELTLTKAQVGDLKGELARAAILALAEFQGGVQGIDFLLREVVGLLSTETWKLREDESPATTDVFRALGAEVIRLAPFSGEAWVPVSQTRVMEDNVTLFHRFIGANPSVFGESGDWWTSKLAKVLNFGDGGDLRVGNYHASRRSEGMRRVTYRRAGLALVAAIVNVAGGQYFLRHGKTIILDLVLPCATSDDKRDVFNAASSVIGTILEAVNDVDIREKVKDALIGLHATDDMAKVRFGRFAALASHACQGDPLVASRPLVNKALMSIIHCDTAQRAALLTFVDKATRTKQSDFDPFDLMDNVFGKLAELQADVQRKSDRPGRQDGARPVVLLALVEFLTFRARTLAGHRLCGAIVHGGPQALVNALPGYRDPLLRSSCYGLLAELHRTFFPQAGTAVKPVDPMTPRRVRDALLAGLADPDDLGMHDLSSSSGTTTTEASPTTTVGVRRFVYDYWRDRLPETNPQRRLDALLDEVFVCADAMPQRYAVSLLLAPAARSKDWHRPIHDRSLGAVFEAEDLIDIHRYTGPALSIEATMRRHQEKPLSSSLGGVADSLTQQASLLFQPRAVRGGRLAATQADTLASFDATQLSTQSDPRAAIRGVVLPSHLLFKATLSQAPVGVVPQPMDVVGMQEDTKTPGVDDDKTRKKTKKRVRFADVVIEKPKKEEKSKVMMYRSYRSGELPDVQISKADVARPLAAAALRDGGVAGALFEQIFAQALKHRQRKDPLIERVRKVLEDPDASSSAELVSTLHRGCLRAIPAGGNWTLLPAATVAESAVRGRVPESGAVLLETLVDRQSEDDHPKREATLRALDHVNNLVEKKQRTEVMKSIDLSWCSAVTPPDPVSREEIAELRRLYAAFDDAGFEVTAAVRMLGGNAKTAIEFESRGRLKEARQCYDEDPLAGDDAVATRLANGRSIHLALSLGDWPSAIETCLVSAERGAGDDEMEFWDACLRPGSTMDAIDAGEILRQYVLSAVLDDGNRLERVLAFLDQGGHHKRWASQNVAPALALAYAVRDDRTSAKRFVDLAYEGIARTWAATHPCAVAARADRLRDLADVADVEKYLSCLKHRDLTWPSMMMTTKGDHPPGMWMRKKRWRDLLARAAIQYDDRYRDSKLAALHLSVRQLGLDAAELALLDMKSIDIAQEFLDNDRNNAQVLDIQCDQRRDGLDQKLTLALARREMDPEKRRNLYLQVEPSAEVIFEFANAVASGSASAPVGSSASNLGRDAYRRFRSDDASFSFAEFLDGVLATLDESEVSRAAFDELASTEMSDDDPRALCVRTAVTNYVRGLVAQDDHRGVPRILALLTSDPEAASQVDLTPIPPPALVPWTSRFVSLVADVPVIEKIVRVLIAHRPDVVRGPLRYAMERLEDKGISQETPIHRLAQGSRDDAAEAFVIAIQGLGNIEIRFRTALQDMIKVLGHHHHHHHHTKKKRKHDDVDDDDWPAQKRAVDRIWDRLRSELLEEEWPLVGTMIGDKNAKFGRAWRNRLRRGSLKGVFGGDDDETWRRGGNLVPRNKEEIPTADANLRKVLQKFDESMDSQRYKEKKKELTTLEAISTHLSSYDGARSSDALPVPVAPWDTSREALKIVAFDPAILEMQSLRKPVKITMRCSDGRDRSYLMKGGEDLRNDERIEHVFDAMRVALKRIRGLRTYGVYPMSPRAGLIEWVEGAQTVKDIVKRCAGEKLMSSASLARDMILFPKNGICGDFRVYRRLYASSDPEQLRALGSKALDAARGVVGKFSKGRSAPLASFLMAMAPRAEAYICVREQYTYSLAATSAATYIVGLGDRHPDNMMLDAKNGTLVHIDLGASFGTGAANLAVPELIPLRLTSQFTSPFLDPSVLHGHLRDALSTFRDHSSTLDAMLRVFATDPVLDWLPAAARFSDEDVVEGAGLPPTVRVDIARGKLKGTHPVDLLSTELSHNHHAEGLRPQLDRFRTTSQKKTLSPSEQAAVLIDLATDSAVLGLAWTGLATWW